MAAAAADLVEQLGISEIVVSMETIKPSSPTPPDLRTHILSWIDQAIVPTHIGVVLFYLQGGGGGGDGFAGAPGDTISERLRLLKQSLSHALSLYYVLAGRIASAGASGAVNCTDEGIDFIDARVDCPLSAVLQTAKNPAESGMVVDLFLPCGRRCTKGGAGGPLLIVKATTFSCGGMALGLCLNHTVADGQSLAFFLKTWASIARGAPPNVEVGMPALEAAAAAFPLLGMLSPYPSPPAATGRPRMVRKRFVLDGSKICALREQSTNRALTRVEAVTALIWRCLIRSYFSATAAGVGGAVPAAAEFAACHDVGLRARVRPPLSETSFGNLIMAAAAFVMCHPVDLPLIDEIVTADSSSSSTTLRGLTEEQTSAAIRGMDGAYIRDTLQGPEGPSAFHSRLGERLRRAATVTWFSSWWGFPLYETDFGWGRPAWVACGGSGEVQITGSAVVLMGRREAGGHMEAWVKSAAEEMARLDRDPELLSLLSSDPLPHIP